MVTTRKNSKSFRLYYIIAVICGGVLIVVAPAVLFFYSLSTLPAKWAKEENAKKPQFEKTFTLIKMPDNFRLITSSFGHDGNEGSLSLMRKYATHSTRESVIKELEPVLQKAGYDFTVKTINDNGGIGNDLYITNKRDINRYPASITIQLYPANSIPTVDCSHIPSGSCNVVNNDPDTLLPQEEVTEVDIEIY